MVLSDLMLGDYQRAWPFHEARFTHACKELLNKFIGLANLEKFAAKPRWQGEDLQGKTILIWSEQGLGDNVMMMRFIRMLSQKGAGACLVYCPPSLVKTMLSITPLVISSNSKLDNDSFDVHCSIMSLPSCFDTRVETIPVAIPYLKTEASAQKKWKQPLQRFGGLKVGLGWAGSKGMGKDGLRSIALSQLASLFDVPGVQIVSLQKDAGAGGTDFSTRGGLDWMAASTDLMDTAALIDQLDLVITVDTVVAHLAGALGKPTWLLNRFESEWRWMTGRSDSPWYPSVRIFRQPALRDWDSVIQDVKQALAALAAERCSKRSEPQEWQKAASDADRMLGLSDQQSDGAGGWRQKIAALWKR